MFSPKVSIAAVVIALPLLFAPAAQSADEHQINLPHSAEIIASGYGVEFMAVYSCAPRLGPVYLAGIVSQVRGGDTDYYEDVTCDGKPHRVRVVEGADLCEDPDEPCFVPGRATITATFYQEATWNFGPRVDQTVILRYADGAATQ
jgi:hypothetical protein